MAARRLRPALRWLPLAGAAPVCGFNGWPTHLANVEDRLCTVGEKKNFVRHLVVFLHLLSISGGTLPGSHARDRGFC